MDPPIESGGSSPTMTERMDVGSDDGGGRYIRNNYSTSDGAGARRPISRR
jgi:hypothetical protein